MSMSTRELASLVEPQRVHRRVYTDPEIFALEMDRIFGQVWLYVAHESQLAKPGDFVRSRLGRYEVLVTRHGDGRIHVLRNRCAHRGAQLCKARTGNRRSFVCGYHGWSFATDGALEGVPHRQSYPAGFSLADPAHRLTRAPRVESYRGFIFASLAPEGPSLTEFLGPMCRSIDNLVDRSPTGTITLAETCFRLEYRGNWKTHHENANDTIHPGFVHDSSVAVARTTPESTEETSFDNGQTREMMEANGFTRREWETIELVAFPSGHSYMGGIYRTGLMARRRADPVQERYRAALVAAYGEARTDEILGLDRFNNLIYPNLNINAQFHQLRVVHPIAADRTQVTSYCFRLDGAPEEIFHRAVRFLSTLGSPMSMIYTDDAEQFERCNTGLQDGGADWIDMARGAGSETPLEDGGRKAPASEVPVRAQFGAWLDLMSRETA